MSFAEIEPFCDGNVLPGDEFCRKCGLSENSTVINDQDVQVDKFMLNKMMHKYMENISDKLPQLLEISANWFRECKRRCVWMAFHDSVFKFAHQAQLVLMTSEMLEPFSDALMNEETKVDVRDLMQQYNPIDSIVVWLWTICDNEGIEANLHKIQQLQEDADLNGAVGDHDPNADEHKFDAEEGVCTCQLPPEIVAQKQKEEHPANFKLQIYGTSCILSIQAVAQKKQALIRKAQELEKITEKPV